MNSNQLFTNLIICIKEALAANNITGWNVGQNYNPVKGNYPKPCILIKRLGTFPEGWQWHYDKKDSNGNLEHYESQQSFVLLRLEALKDRNVNEPQEQTAADVLEAVKMYFNAPAGIKLLRFYGLNPYRIENIEEPEYITDNEVFEFHPYFDFKIIVFETHKSPQAAITAAEFKGVKGV